MADLDVERNRPMLRWIRAKRQRIWAKLPVNRRLDYVYLQGCSQAFLPQAVFVKDWVFNFIWDIITLPKGAYTLPKGAFVRAGVQGVLWTPWWGSRGEVPLKLWISEHLEGLDEFILNTYKLKSGRKTHYKSYHNLLEYILFYTEQLSSPVIQNLSARLLLYCYIDKCIKQIKNTTLQ